MISHVPTDNNDRQITFAWCPRQDLPNQAKTILVGFSGRK